MALALIPSLSMALDEPITWRGLIVGLGLVALRDIWPVAAFIPRWSLVFIIGGILLWAGMTWESRVNDVRTASRYVPGLH